MVETKIFTNINEVPVIEQGESRIVFRKVELFPGFSTEAVFDRATGELSFYGAQKPATSEYTKQFMNKIGVDLSKNSK